MTIDEAKNIIINTFQNNFDKNRFKVFIRNLLKENFEEKTFTMLGYNIPELYKGYIKKYERIGKYEDNDENRIDILAVELDKSHAIEWARTAQRNFIRWYLTKSGHGEMKDAVLAAFYTEGADEWRFSFIKMQYSFEKKKDDFTPAKRYSYLVGKYEYSHTAQKQILPLIQNDEIPTFEELETAFSVEKVTALFFDEYYDLYKKLKQALDNSLNNYQELKLEFERKNIDADAFAKKTLGQIVFLYFLQKKGWLGVPENKDLDKGEQHFMQNRFADYSKHGQNYFNDFLKYLFYEALATNREETPEHKKNYYPRFNCIIPFLNGGLFEPLNDFDWQKFDLHIPNNLFWNDNPLPDGDKGTGIFNVFDRYNFTVSEDEPLEKEVAVDPEMLGKVFENLLEQNQRKSKGAFYTPREIVHYMCQESLINYLNTKFNSEKGLIPRNDIEVLIRKGLLLIENEKHVESLKKETETYTYKIPETIRDNAVAIDNALKDIKVCDPAIGSGAFPVGLLIEIVNARRVINEYLPLKQQNTSYQLKWHAIHESIYGVDIDASAVDIAKLRLWLSLVVDENDYLSIKPLPNLDYKIICGNSLIGLPPEVMRDISLQKEVEDLKDRFFETTNHDEKLSLKKEIDIKIRKLLDSAEQFISYKIDFDFDLYFSEISRLNKGFDIVIGNPPYLKERDNAKIFEPVNNSWLGKNYHQGKMDYWFYFLHKAIDITKSKGIISFITSRYWLNSTGASKLINRVKNNLSFIDFVDIGNLKVFHNVVGYHMIAIYSKDKNKDEFLYKKIENDISDIEKNIETNNLKILVKRNNNIYSKYNQIVIEESLMHENTIELRNLFDTSIGVQESTDRITKKHIESSSRSDIKQGQGVFVLNKLELEMLNLSNSEKNYIKNYLDPKDVDKYFINQSAEKYLIYSNKNCIKEIMYNPDFKNLKKHLDNLKEFITSSNKPYGLHRTREVRYFISPKIIFKNMFKTCSFAYDDNNFFFGFSFSSIIQKTNKLDLKFLLAILNSKYAEYWFYKNGKKRGVGVDIGVEKLRTFPLVVIPKENQIHFIRLVDYIIELKKIISHLITAKDKLMPSYFEQIVDGMVFELYFADAMKEKGLEIAKHLNNLPDIGKVKNADEKIGIIKQVFTELDNEKHPIRYALFMLNTVPEIQTIYAQK